MSRYLLAGLACLAIISSSTLLVVGYRYIPVQVDGGWASYGGYAVSQDREPYLHQAELHEVRDVPGVKALFGFDTVSNTRAMYTGAWFRIFGPGWRSLKALSILEFTVLMAAAAAFFWVLLPTPELAAIALCLLATDKMMVLMAASTFRPDVSQAGLACAFYLILRRIPSSVIATVALAALAVLAGTFSASAVIPVALAAILRATELALGSDTDKASRLAQLGVAVSVAAACYLFRQSIFPVILGSERTVLEPVDALNRIAASWAMPETVLLKEWSRWSSYFLGWNLPLLAAIGIGCLASFWRDATRRSDLGQVVPVWAAAVALVAILLVLDPHARPQHLAPGIPFLLLLLRGVEDLEPTFRRAALGGLASLVVLSSVSGVILASGRAAEARAVGFSNAWLQDTLGELTADVQELTVAGGTEFWPYWDQDSNVTIVDHARTPDQIGVLEPLLSELDYAVLSADYRPSGWIRLAEERYGIRLRVVLDKRPFVVIATGFGGSGRP